jgi:alanyl-tRNA synthetase
MADRLYYADPSLTIFDARVFESREAPRSEGRSLWQIILDRTAFYPTSGGQPHDTGMLTAMLPGGDREDVPVLAVEEDEQGEVWHTTPRALAPGTVVRGFIDWSRRRDHMQQHSGQHLLSAVIYKLLGAPTVSFHLGEMTSTIDISRDGITEEDLERVEEQVNELIAENRAVTMRTVPRHEAEMLREAGSLLKLPDRAGDIRLIEIDEFDLNACGGTHVHATGQIGGLLLRGTERVRQGLRIEYVCGLRAVVAARQDRGTLTQAGALLSTARAEVPDAVERLQTESRAAHKTLEKMNEALATWHAKSLTADLAGQENSRIVREVFTDRDIAYLKLLASRLSAGDAKVCVLLASTQEDPARLIMAAGNEVTVHCGTRLREALAPYGSRGGGSPGMAQGQIAGAHLEAVLDTLEAAFQQA